MRNPLRRFPYLVITISLPAVLFFAGPLFPADVEYGHLDELKGVERVHVWTDNNPALRADVERRLKEGIPLLTVVETEEEAQIVFAVKRRPAKEDSPDPEKRFVTTGSVIRPLTSTRLRLITDLVSTKESLEEATAEITRAFINHLKVQNVKRYGRPDDDMKVDTRQFRSMAGLRTGIPRAAVIKAIGFPTRIEGKGSTMPIWFYETTDGTYRLVFRGDVLFATQFVEAKKKK